MSITQAKKTPPVKAANWRPKLTKHLGNFGGHVAFAMRGIWKGGEKAYNKFLMSAAKENKCRVHRAGGGKRWRLGPLFCYTHNVAFDDGDCPCKGQYNVKRPILPFWWRVWDRLKTMAQGKFNGPIIEQT